LQQRGAIERIEKGKYLIIPLGAEKGKYTLHEFVIGSLLVQPYSIAYWSALNYYGLTEQIPATVFIQTITRKFNINPKVFGIQYKIVKIKESKCFGIRKEWIEETQINITDKEKTIIDCLNLPQYASAHREFRSHQKAGISLRTIKYKNKTS
jgi:predicted transcriptional regulator of viral defense system